MTNYLQLKQTSLVNNCKIPRDMFILRTNVVTLQRTLIPYLSNDIAQEKIIFQC